MHQYKVNRFATDYELQGDFELRDQVNINQYLILKCVFYLKNCYLLIIFIITKKVYFYGY